MTDESRALTGPEIIDRVADVIKALGPDTLIEHEAVVVIKTLLDAIREPSRVAGWIGAVSTHDGSIISIWQKGIDALKREVAP